MKIYIEIDGQRLRATLEENNTASDFAALLPIELELTDYAATEKISDLPKRLTTSGAPAGVKASAGDIAYYAPWGNLAFFHKDFGYSKGLIKLGTLMEGIELLRKSGSLRATIEADGQLSDGERQ